jgi:hypothetical protein
MGIEEFQRSKDHDEDVDKLLELYGSFGSAFWTLFAAISGGMDWSDAATPLQKISLIYKILFAFYVGLATFALLNVLNGIFVDSAVQSAAMRREMAVDTALSDMRSMIGGIISIFVSSDEEHNGLITKDKFCEFYLREEKVKAYFMSLELDLESVNRIFDFLAEGAEELPLDVLVEGCINYRGAAKSFQLTTLQNSVEARISDVNHKLDIVLAEVTRGRNGTR